MKIVYEGPNSEDMLGKPNKKITKYKDDKGVSYTVTEGDDNVHVEFLDAKECEQGERIDFMNRYTMPLSKFRELEAKDE